MCFWLATGSHGKISEGKRQQSPLALSSDPPATGGSRAAKSWARRQERQGERFRDKMTRAWPDEVASVTEGGDGARFLSLPLPALVRSPPVRVSRCLLLERKSSCPSSLLSLLPHPPRQGYRIWGTAASGPLGFAPQPKPSSRPLSAQWPLSAGLDQSPGPWVLAALGSCFFLLHPVIFVSSIAHQGLGGWGLEVVNSTEGSCLQWEGRC